MGQLSQKIAAATANVVPASRAIQPPLFVGQGADGNEYAFVILKDGRCAITREGKVMQTWGNSELGIDTALDQFRALTGPAGLPCVSERARAFAVLRRPPPAKGGRHAKQR